MEGAAFLEGVATRAPFRARAGHPDARVARADPGARDGDERRDEARAAEKFRGLGRRQSYASDLVVGVLEWWATPDHAAERLCRFRQAAVRIRVARGRVSIPSTRVHARTRTFRTRTRTSRGGVRRRGVGNVGVSRNRPPTSNRRVRAFSARVVGPDWSDADDVDARSFRDRTFVRAVRSPPREGVSNRGGTGEPARGGRRAARSSTSRIRRPDTAFDEHVRHRRERQRERRRGRRRASRSETHLRWWDSAGVLILFTFSRVFDWRRPSHWLKVLMDGCFWRAREVVWDRATTRTRAAMREYRATGSTWAHELVMRRIVVLRTPHLCLTSVQSLFGSFLSPEWFDPPTRAGARRLSLGHARPRTRGVAPETVPEFTTVGPLPHRHHPREDGAQRQARARRGSRRLHPALFKPDGGFSYRSRQPFHRRASLLRPAMRVSTRTAGWLRASAEETARARARWAAFIVADSLVAAGVLLCGHGENTVPDARPIRALLLLAVRAGRRRDERRRTRMGRWGG